MLHGQDLSSVGATQVFVARQPIFGPERALKGYELLFRSDMTQRFRASNRSAATLEVISAGLMTFGLERLADGKRAFIHFTQPLLVGGAATLLPKTQVVIEIVENVVPTEAVLKACSQLRADGYTLALDGFTLKSPMAPYLDLAHIVKLDFRRSKADERAKIARLVHSRNRILLGEKVETLAELKEAESLGCNLLQGYFFCRPSTLNGRSLSASEIHCLRAFQEVTRDDVNYDRLTDIIKRDVSFSYKLLRFVNSAAIGLRTRITSIRQALVLLGQKETTRWLSLVAMRDLGRNKPNALMTTCVVRGRLAETLAPAVGLKGRSSELFLLGLFSSIDALLNRPAAEAVRELPLSPDVQQAIVGSPNALRKVLDVVLAYEAGKWDDFALASKRAGIEENNVPELYLEAVAWANLFLQCTADPQTQARAVASVGV